MKKVIDALYALRPPAVLDESELCDMVADCLMKHGILFSREYRLGHGCRADFLLVGGLLIEVKSLERGARAVAKQLNRYAAFDEVTGLLLVTNTALKMPDSIGGKPLTTLFLKRLWGVSL